MLQKLLKQYLLEQGTTMLKPVDGVREKLFVYWWSCQANLQLVGRKLQLCPFCT
jgi:hypothetical protein